MGKARLSSCPTVEVMPSQSNISAVAAASPHLHQRLSAPAPTGRKLRGMRMHALVGLACLKSREQSCCGLSTLPLDILQTILDCVPAYFISHYEEAVVSHSFGSFGPGPEQFKDIGQLAFGRNGSL